MPGSSPTNACIYIHKYVDQKDLAVMVAAKSQQVLHKRWIWGIYCLQVRKHASKGSILALKPSTDVIRSPKQAPEKGLMSSKFFFKKIKREDRQKRVYDIS